MKWRLLDAIGPFFRGHPRGRINWSKIPFQHLERGGRLDRELFRGIRHDFERLADAAAALGFNALTLDDLAHVTRLPGYRPALLDKLAEYREQYLWLCEAAAARGLSVFLTSDVMFAHRDGVPALTDFAGGVVPALTEALEQAYALHPAVAGVILRLGECDGLDVGGDFRSHLAVRTPRQARLLLRSALSAAARHGRLLVVRTWTVGAYPIGDLAWNRHTYDAVFGGFDSPNLAVSMKYGESDFYRYLPLNKLFFRGRQAKWIELQTRREYEGFGEYPSFVGWDYEEYLRQLAGSVALDGVWIWCQTGGWSAFRRRTFLDAPAVWSELNTAVTARIAFGGECTEEAVAAVARTRLGLPEPRKLLTLLRLSVEVVHELLYVDDLARRKLFFRRVRVPPLLSVFWDHIIVSRSMRRLLRCFVNDGDQKILQGRSALAKIRVMQRLAVELGLPAADLQFQYDTFEILAAAREYYFGPFTAERVEQLSALRRRYVARYPVRYAVQLDFRRFGVSRRRLRLLLALLLRRKRGYRLLDHLLVLRLLAWLAPLARGRKPAFLPGFVQRQAMGLDSLLR